MNRTALVLAAHGSRVDPRTNQALVDLANRIASRRIFSEVATTFHQGSPTFAEVLDTLSSDEVTVVPIMTSAGYYCDEVLPSEMAKSWRFIGLSLQQTPPVGLHYSMPDLVDRRARQLAASFKFEPVQTTLSVIGHGTARNPKSRLSTEALTEGITHRGQWGQVLCAFLDETPGVETVLSRATFPNVIVMPFLISGGPHVTVDIPARLGLDVSTIREFPYSQSRDGETLIVDRAIGQDERIEELVLDLALQGIASLRARSASDEPNLLGTLEPLSPLNPFPRPLDGAWVRNTAVGAHA